jgi:ribosomal protein L1
MKVLALVTPDKEAEAKEAGADYVGLDEYIDKIKGGWTDVDVIITMPSVMGKVRTIRTCIRSAWFNAKPQKWNSYYGCC